MQTKGPALAEASPVLQVAGGEGGQMAGAIVGGDKSEARAQRAKNQLFRPLWYQYSRGC